MQKKNLFKKKFNKLVLSITKRIESFFNFLTVNIFHKKNFFKSLKTVDKKIFLSAATIFISLISYFLIPALYDEKKITSQIEKQIFDQYNLEVKFDQDLRYDLFPKPHFLFKNTKIEYKSNNLARTKDTKVFISINNFFLSDNIKIKNLVFNKTDFKIKGSNFKFFVDLLQQIKSSHKINFLNSKFFYLDQNDDIVFLSSIKRLDYEYEENLVKKLRTKLDIYNFPINLELDHNILENEIAFEAKLFPLRLIIQNKSSYNDKNLNGELNLTILNKDTKIKYSLRNNSLNFNTKDNKITGEINIKPFFISSNLKLFQIDLKKIFRENSILINILKSEVLNNNNLNGEINISTGNFEGLNFLKKIKFIVRVEEGNIFVTNLRTIFKDSVVINLDDAQLIVDNNKLKLAGYISLDFIDITEFYAHYQINRNYRKNIKKINFGFLFNLDDQFIEIDNLKVNGNINQNLEKFLNNFNSKKENILNKIVFRNSVKNFLKNY